MNTMDKTWTLEDFVRESNLIEGIHREPSSIEIDAHAIFLALEQVNVPDLERFVAVIQPGAKLRCFEGMNVQVGGHIAPPGGYNIENDLRILLHEAEDGRQSPWTTHRDYQNLHPFMDGNGRSGRVLWLRMMGGKAPIGFLRQFYYQTLEAAPVP